MILVGAAEERHRMMDEPMVWPIRVVAETTGMNGRRIRMSRTVEGAGDVVGAMKKALAMRRDGGWPFAGCEIMAVTPLGQRVVRVLNPDTGELSNE